MLCRLSFYGGAERDRTADLLVANEALSQLSYSPPPNAPRTPLPQAQRRRTTSPSVPASTPRFKLQASQYHPAQSLRQPNPPRHCGPCGQWLLHHMPNLTPGIHHRPQHRHHQPRSTPSHRLQLPHRTDAKLRRIQRHLPALPPLHPRLLANIRHNSSKRTHFAATGLTAATSASISRLLPTQNAVR